MADEVRVNGNVFSWGSLRFRIDGELYSGLTAIEYGDSVEKSFQYGMGKHQAPRGRSRGKYTPDALVVTGAADTIDTIYAALGAKDTTGAGVAQVEVPATLTYDEPGRAPWTVEYDNCSCVKNEESHEESAEGLIKKLTFSTMRIRRNGIALYDTSTPGA